MLVLDQHGLALASSLPAVDQSQNILVATPPRAGFRGCGELQLSEAC